MPIGTIGGAPQAHVRDTSSASPGGPARPTGRGFLEVLREGQRSGPAQAPPPAGPPARLTGPTGAAPVTRPSGAAPETTQTRGAPDPVRALRGAVQGALDAERRLDRVMAEARRGRSFSAGELLALQADVFRYSQTVELLSRAADRVVGAVKQTLGTQV